MIFSYNAGITEFSNFYSKNLVSFLNFVFFRYLYKPQDRVEKTCLLSLYVNTICHIASENKTLINIVSVTSFYMSFLYVTL